VFRLAEHLGGVTVGELLARISSRELTEWQAFFILEAEDREQQEMAASSMSGAESRRWRR
jgi:hypothetical protein